MAENYTDAINAINERISHHASEAKKAKLEVSRLTVNLQNASSAMSIQESTVASLEKARKILVDAENASRANDKAEDINDNPVIL